jgi:beta-glucosidase
LLDFLIAPYDAFVSRVAAQGNKTSITASLSNDLNAGVAAARGKDVAIVFANAYVLLPKFLIHLTDFCTKHER